MSSKKSRKKIRGVFEKVPGSDIWWIQYFDASGRRRREKAGRRSDAITLLSKRKTEKLQRKKLPENLRTKPVTFGELADDAIEHFKAENGERSTQELTLKYETLRPVFGSRAAEDISKQEIVRWLTSTAADRELGAGHEEPLAGRLQLGFPRGDGKRQNRQEPGRAHRTDQRRQWPGPLAFRGRRV